MINNKIYIGLITSGGNSKYLEWYNEASRYIDGLAVTWHGEKDDGYEILNKNKGCGFIVEMDYYGHHGHSMNHWLLNPKIRPNSWCIIRDTLEVLNIDFLKNIRSFCHELEKRTINTVYQYSKCLMFKKHEHQFFTNGTHWGFQNAKPHFLEIEKQPGFDNPRNYAYSIRNDVRPIDHSLSHFLSYYLADSSNHLLLGRENKTEEFQIHEEVRYKFKKHVEEELKIPLNVKSLSEYCKNNTLTYTTKWFLNFEEILNSWFCYHILGHKLEDVRARQVKKELYEI
jgi:hypothetical protein